MLYRNTLATLFCSLLLSVSACGDDGSSGPTTTAENPANGEDLDASTGEPKIDAGTKKDAAVTPPAKDAGIAAKDASVAKDAAVTGIDSGTPATADAAAPGKPDAAAPGKPDASGPIMSVPDAGAPNKCQNLICFDVFDCAIFHPDALDCGFTSCTGFVCTK
ncbi:MAG: hypothetical protein JWN48_3377 [Myxococcaceae bacterium]|nr:hypothetical protein [Myxococcaceae bacterium]